MNLLLVANLMRHAVVQASVVAALSADLVFMRVAPGTYALHSLLQKSSCAPAARALEALLASCKEAGQNFYLHAHAECHIILWLLHSLSAALHSNAS